MSLCIPVGTLFLDKMTELRKVENNASLKTPEPPSHGSVRPSDTGVSAEVAARLSRLKEELAAVTQACEDARKKGETGGLFFLLRKKWKLTQRIFEIESGLRLRTGR